MDLLESKTKMIRVLLKPTIRQAGLLSDRFRQGGECLAE
jgi:hypothetical protein